MKRLKILVGSVIVMAAVLVAATSHTVVKGDTLWDISGKYLGDPFKWTSVWKKNPQIANPNLIYPGDVVQIDGEAGAGGEGRSGSGDSLGGARRFGADSLNPAVAAALNDPFAEFPVGLDHQKVVAVDTASSIELVGPPAQSVLNAEAIALAPVLYTSQELPSGVESELIWDKEYGRHTLLPGEYIDIRIGSSNGLQVSDRIQIVESGERVVKAKGASEGSRVEQVRALAVVTEVRENQARCLISKIYGSISGKAVARPFRPLPEVSVSGFKTTDDGFTANVLANTRNSRIQMPGTYLILDQGSSGGVQAGDIFEFMNSDLPRGQAAMRGFGIVVRSGSSYATVFLVGATLKPVVLGDRAWRIRRAIQS